MERTLTVVMYHYVRDLLHSRYPHIKGLDVSQFRGQIDYIKAHYQVISVPQLLDSLRGGEPLPPEALLLTFDDAYLDHFIYVFPILDKEKLSASFFPPAKCVINHEVLDVNKIHFLLAAADPSILISRIRDALRDAADEFSGISFATLWERVAQPSRYDPADVIFVKRVLQRELPHALRQRIVSKLFHEFVTSDEKAFSRELYMDKDQLIMLRRHGMHIGSHGYEHRWLNHLDEREQEIEIDHSLRFLQSLGCPTDDWTLCYPYGGYNESLLKLLKDRKCALGFTTELGLADPSTMNPLLIPRLNTNGPPKQLGPFKTIPGVAVSARA